MFLLDDDEIIIPEIGDFLLIASPPPKAKRRLCRVLNVRMETSTIVCNWYEPAQHVGAHPRHVRRSQHTDENSFKSIEARAHVVAPSRFIAVSGWKFPNVYFTDQLPSEKSISETIALRGLSRTSHLADDGIFLSDAFADEGVEETFAQVCPSDGADGAHWLGVSSGVNHEICNE